MRGCNYEDRDGVIWIWNPQQGHVRASCRSAAYLRTERLAQRYRLSAFTFDGKRRPVALFPILRTSR